MPNLYACGLCVRPKSTSVEWGYEGWNKKLQGFSLVSSSLRLYLMCLDILEKGEIVTYREKEHDLLMDIRNGKFLDSNGQPIPEFFEMVKSYEDKLEYAKSNTDLPNKPNYKKIKEFTMSVNERVVKGTI